MKVLVGLIFTIITIFTKFSIAIVFIREQNLNGPSYQMISAKCLKLVADAYFHQKVVRHTENTIFTHLKNLSTPAAQIEIAFIKLMHEIDFTRVELRNIRKYRTVSDQSKVLLDNSYRANMRKAETYVIVTDSVEKAREIFEGFLSKTKSWNPSAKFLFLYNNQDETLSASSVAESVFQMLLQSYNCPNVILMFTKDHKPVYQIYVSDPFTETHCGRAIAKYLGECNSSGIMSYTSEPISTPRRQYKNCTLKICARIAHPYIERDCKSGLEYAILKLIQNKWRFKEDINCSYTNRGVLLDDGTFTHLLGRVANGECDVTIGGFFPDNEVSENYATSKTYLADSYTWFVSRAAKEAPWKGLVSIFSIQTWACFFVVLIISGVVWLILGRFLPELIYHRIFALTLLNTWGITFNVSVNHRPHCTATRIFFVALSLYALTVTSIYTSRLISVFSHPGFQYQIKLFEEIVSHNIPFGGRAEYQDWFENEDDRIILKKYNTSIDPTPHTIQLVADGKQAILESRLLLQKNSQRDKLYEFKQNVFSSPMQMIARQGFPLLNEFNQVINHLKSSGLIEKILDDDRFETKILEKIRNRHNDPESDITLTLDHLSGAFAILSIGLSLSTCVFFIEIALNASRCFWTMRAD